MATPKKAKIATLTTPDGSVQILPRTSAKAVATEDGKTVEEKLSSAGDMFASTYDPTGKAQDVFAYADKKAGFPKIGPASAAWDLDKGGILFITDDEKVPRVTPEATFVEMQVALQAFFDNYGADASAIEAWCTIDNLSFIGIIKVDGSALTEEDMLSLVGLWYSFNYWDYKSASDVSWYQIEHLVAYFSPSYSDDATTKATLESAGITIPDWVLRMWPVSAPSESSLTENADGTEAIE